MNIVKNLFNILNRARRLPASQTDIVNEISNEMFFKWKYPNKDKLPELTNENYADRYLIVYSTDIIRCLELIDLIKYIQEGCTIKAYVKVEEVLKYNPIEGN